MKKKYYMRGLGLGVLITAILCAVALPKQTQPMTDEEIIARAEELGYVKDEGGVTADDIDKIKDKEKTSGTPAPGATEEPEMTDVPEGTPGPTQSPVPTPEAPEPPDMPDKPDVPATPTPKPVATPTPVPTMAPTEVPKPTATTSYTISVERGATARSVAVRLEEVGALADADAFVKYLQSRNLTDFINIGTFTIPQGASETEIARIITGR